jgi:DNA-directed RNA polymerase subunit beta
MNKLFVNNIGDLAEAQRASFYRFLSLGISEELSNFPNPFIAKIRISVRKKLPCLVYLYPNEIKLKGPNHNLETCLKKDLSYTIQLYIPGEYSYPSIQLKKDVNLGKSINENIENSLSKVLKNKRIRIKQDIFFGEIPLMTEEGTFIISGCERVVISQIIRSPGIYFRKEFTMSGKTIYGATVISNKGLWTKFILDLKPKNKEKDKLKEEEQKDRIYIKLNDFKNKISEEKEDIHDNSNKLFIYDLIRYFGLNVQEVVDSLKYPLYLTNQEYLVDENKNLQQGINNDYETSVLIRKLFFNQKSGCFSIGEIGRYKINKKLGINLPKDITYLTAHDFIGIINGLVELKYYDRSSDDIDDIRNKQIRCIGELLQNQIRVGIYRLRKNLMDDSKVSSTPKLNFDLETYSDPDDWILDPRPLTTSIKEFFKTSQLSQFMDQINPLAELTHKRRISVFGPNGLKRDHISTVIRDIHPSQYGRLCPIETPEGQNAGLITSMSMYSRIGTLGSLETPYFLMKDGNVFCDKQPIFLNPEQESETIIAFADVGINNENKIKDSYLSAKENYLFSVKKVNNINFITTSPLQIVSLATALIPFLEHDDANRALMGSNMQRQAVPLLYTQKPIIGTGLEAVAILDSGMVIKNYCEGFVKFSSSQKILVDDLLNQSITYYLKKYYRSNQETCINQRPVVWIGEKVFSGQNIADGPRTNDGE